MRSALASPGELDLQLALVVSDLDLDLQVDFVWHAHGDATSGAIELDGVVPSESISKGMEPGRGVLATKVPGLIYLEQVHVVSSGRAVGVHRGRSAHGVRHGRD
jgi:hypothetical protein